MLLSSSPDMLCWGSLPALTAENDGSQEEEERGGDQQEETKHGEDADHLDPVEDHGAPRVAQLAPAGPGVVVSEEEVSLIFVRIKPGNAR